MGRNQRDGGYKLPIDQYRKNIGREDYKKSKQKIKDTKTKAEVKDQQRKIYKDAFPMVAILLLTMVAVYVFLYYVLSPSAT